MQKEIFDLLAEKYLAGKAGEREQKIIEAYLDRLAIKNPNKFTASETRQIVEDVYERIRLEMNREQAPVIPLKLYRWKTMIAAAAAILVLFASAVWYFNSKNTQSADSASVKPMLQDALPAKEGATLTLADGSTIVLDSAANGILALQENTAITKKDGQVTYNPGIYSTDSGAAFSPFEKGGDAKRRGISTYNTMTTPRGRQFSMILGDGTKVWLNAASSITFPTAFTGNERNVKITGEVYFEVAKDKRRPFKVQINQGAYPPLAGAPKRSAGGGGPSSPAAAPFEIEVLGTSFNVKAYADESSPKASLLEGSIKIATAILKPGQAFTSGKITSTDIQQDIAWKNGVFNFNHIVLPEAMRQISRWYDVEVNYGAGVKDIEFGGRMGRNLTLRQVLRGLEGIEGVHYELNGKVLTITKQLKQK